MLRAAVTAAAVATTATAVEVVVGLAVGSVVGVVTGAMVETMVDQEARGRTCQLIFMTFLSLATLTPSDYLVFPILSVSKSDIFILDSKETPTVLKMASGAI